MINPAPRTNLIMLALLFIISTPVFAQESTLSPAPLLHSTDAALDKLAAPVSVYKDDVRLKMDGEFRYRMEYRDDFNFNSAAYEDDAFSLFRSRLGLKLESDLVTLYAQGQDSESVADSGLNKTNAFVDQLDLHQLYAEIKSPRKELPLALKVGRQELSYGDQRYVGAFGWSNVARVFDAVKIVAMPTSWFKVDTWFSQVVDVNRKKADSARHHENFYGLYTSLGPWKDQNLDSFIFMKHDRNNELVGEQAGQRGQLKEYTLGNRFKGKWNQFDYGIEWAAQAGSRAHNEIRAWSWHNDLGYTFVKLPAVPKLSFEYNHGSGDSNPTDGTVENFDNLYPTNHPFYGFMDLASLRNINDVALILKLQPWTKVKFEYGHHWLFLATNNSAWFNAAQTAIRPASSGASTTLGQESDLLLTWAVSKHVDLLTGYSFFHAGAFINDTGTADDANFFYVQTSIKV